MKNRQKVKKKIIRFSHCPEIMKNRQCLKIIKAMRFPHCPEIMKNRQKV
jgi:hypothetical protein